MKYSITISDLTSTEEVHNVLYKLQTEACEPIDFGTTTAEISQAEDLTRATLEKAVSFVNNPPVTQTSPTILPVVPDTVGVAAIAGAIPAAGVETDKNDLPWDERIHSSNRKQTSKGIWQKRRGLQDFEYDAVVKELQGGDWRNWKDETPVTPAPTADSKLDVQAFVERNNLAPVVVPVSAPTAVPPGTVVPPVPVVVPTPVAAVTARDFLGLMTQIQQLFDSQQIQPEYLNTIVTRINENFQVKIVALTDVANDEKLVDYAWKCLANDGKAA